MINMAMSIDGKTSSSLREPTTFTSREDKKLLMRLRAKCDALISAATTVKVEQATMRVGNPKLQAQRVRAGKAPSPIRIIVSGHLNLSPDLPVFKKGDAPLILVCCETAPMQRRKRFSKLARVFVCGKKEVHIPKLLKFLVKEYQVKVLLCEGGATLNDAFFRARCVNDLYVTLCPKIVGGKEAPTLVDGKGFSKLNFAAEGKLVSCRKGSEEYFLRYQFQ